MSVAALTRGERVCAFIERYCRCPEGSLVGAPMRLEPFQRDFLIAVYDNPHGTHSAYLSIARKNGKSAIVAAIMLAHLCGPEAVHNSQIVTGARSKDQAAVIFELAAKMVQLSPELSAVVAIHPSGKRLVGIRRNVLFRALAAEGKTAHGLSPVLAILDEVGQVEGPTDPFVEAIVTAQGAYENPLLIAISTQAPTDADMFSLWIDGARAANDPRVVCHVYEAPADCALDDRAAWAAANPALGTFRSLGDVEKQCAKAQAIPANEPSFRNLVLNQRVETVSPFVSKNVWASCAAAPKPLAKGRRVWGGLDLSSVADLTALTLVDDGHGVHCTFWLPAEGLREKSHNDRVPYDLWAKQGFLQTTPGKAIEYEFVAARLREVFDTCDVQKLAFDRALFLHLRPWLVKAGFTERELELFEPYGQGTLSMTPALRELEVLLTQGKLAHGAHPVLEMCARNVRVVGESGARKFDKRKSRGRIDGMVALAMACGVMPAAGEAPKKYAVYFA